MPYLLDEVYFKRLFLHFFRYHSTLDLFDSLHQWITMIFHKFFNDWCHISMHVHLFVKRVFRRLIYVLKSILVVFELMVALRIICSGWNKIRWWTHVILDLGRNWIDVILGIISWNFSNKLKILVCIKIRFFWRCRSPILNNTIFCTERRSIFSL